MKFRVLAVAVAALAIALPTRGAAADRHQVQPRRRRRHAEGQGRRLLQEARRGAHQGQGQGRGLSEQPAVQGRGGDGGAAARLGADAGAVGLAKFGPLGAREFEVFDLPYIFDNYDELHKVTEGAVGKALFKKLESKGIIGLAYWDNGFKDMSANKPLRKPEDYEGAEDAHPVVEGAGRARCARSARCRR